MDQGPSDPQTCGTTVSGRLSCSRWFVDRRVPRRRARPVWWRRRSHRPANLTRPVFPAGVGVHRLRQHRTGVSGSTIQPGVNPPPPKSLQNTTFTYKTLRFDAACVKGLKDSKLCVFVCVFSTPPPNLVVSPIHRTTINLHKGKQAHPADKARGNACLYRNYGFYMTISPKWQKLSWGEGQSEYIGTRLFRQHR